MDTTQAQEELLYIRRVIEDSRASFAEDGKPFIAWGIIVSLGMLATYAEVVLESKQSYSGWLWLGLSALGIIYTLTNERRQAKTNRAKTYAEKLQGSLWGAVGITIGVTIPTISIVHSMQPDWSIHPIFTCGIVAFYLAIAYYVSGSIMQLNWLRNVSFAWWIGAVSMIAFPSVHVLLVYAIMIVLFQVIPGIVLYRNWKKLQPTALATA